jgi:E3 ubiquitin-protein ligase SHPRH
MIDQHVIQMQTNERSLFWSMVKRGQLHEDSKNIEEAMNVWQETLKLVQASVTECRQSVADELKKAKESDKESQKDPKGKSKPKDDDVEDEDEKTSGRVTGARARLKAVLEIEHACNYWLGTGKVIHRHFERDSK